MKSARASILAVITHVLLTCFCFSQDNPNLEIGLKPYGSFQGGKIDSISMNNGNAFVRIPIWSLAGRGGKLDLSFSLIHNSKGFVVRKFCPPTGCYEQWRPIGNFGF